MALWGHIDTKKNNEIIVNFFFTGQIRLDNLYSEVNKKPRS